MKSRFSIFALIGPGMLIAATGVGAGDLAGAGLAGSKLGLAILWAVLLGAFFKFVLTEGLTRWQLATGSTLLEGAVEHFGWTFRLIFGAYFLIWTYVTVAAIMSACGVTMQAIAPIFDDANGKLFYAFLQSLIGVAVAWWGGFKVFQRCMSVCIGIMFITVIITAIMLKPDLNGVLQGLFTPTIPDLHGEGLTWTIGLLGGIGGTVTILCYGYWIREAGRTSPKALRLCRLDLASGYIMTALFGLAMVVIASGTSVSGKGVGFIVGLANQLEIAIGPGGRWVFLIGAWAAVFSSLLGVWQAVPYLFADLWRLSIPGAKGGAIPGASSGASPGAGSGQKRSDQPVDTRAWPYRIFLIVMAILPLLQVRSSFEYVQRTYVVTGAFFIPLLALGLLVMNSRSDWIGHKHRNRLTTTFVLLLILGFFAWAGYLKLSR